MGWIFYSEGWMLPAFGFVVGLLTNWVALKMIFEPVEVVHLPGGIELQGRFLRRQQEASEEYGNIVATRVLTSRHIIRAIIRGRCSDNFFALLHQQVRRSFDDLAGYS